MSSLPKSTSKKHFPTTLQIHKTTTAETNAAVVSNGTLYALIGKLKDVFQKEYGQPPTWRSPDYKALERLYREKPDVEEIAVRYEHFVKSGLLQHEQQGGSPRFFERNFDKFIDSVPTHQRSAAAVRPRGKRYPRGEVVKV